MPRWSFSPVSSHSRSLWQPLQKLLSSSHTLLNLSCRTVLLAYRVATGSAKGLNKHCLALSMVSPGLLCVQSSAACSLLQEAPRAPWFIDAKREELTPTTIQNCTDATWILFFSCCSAWFQVVSAQCHHRALERLRHPGGSQHPSVQWAVCHLAQSSRGRASPSQLWCSAAFLLFLSLRLGNKGLLELLTDGTGLHYV